jgi:hypothetical protein
MTAQAERQAIFEVFNAGWGSTTTVARPNESFSPPRDYWARVSIRSGEAFTREMGGAPVHRVHPGVVFVDIFAPVGRGNGRALELAQQAAQLFTAQKVKSFSGGQVRFNTPTIRDIGQNAEGTFYHVQASIPYARDALY